MHKKRLLSLCIALVASGQLYAQTNESSNDVEEMEVTGVRQAELNAREEERKKNIFSSVISQDDAGNFADQNVAESLQRLPGINLQKSEGEGRYVSVRGLGPSFVTVQQNGAEMASAGADDRAFALDAIASDSLGAIEVFKSLTPDMDLNSIAGVVNVKTINAFDRKGDSLKGTIQTFYQDYHGENSPKISLQGTNKFLDDTLGIGYSVSWEERNTVNYEMLHHETTDMRFVQQSLPVPHPPSDANDLNSYMLIPFEFQNRQELAERERINLGVDVRFRPNETDEYYAVGSYNKYTDNDLAWREYYRFGQADVNDIIYLDPTNNIFGIVGADIQQQMFIQKGTSETTTFALGGKNSFDVNNGSIEIKYEYNYSNGTFEKPDAKRVQFREREVPLIAKAGKDYIVAQAINAEDLANLANFTLSEINFKSDQIAGYTDNGISLKNFNFDNLFLENSGREDDLNAISFDIKRNFDDGFISYVKTGFQIKERERTRNQDRWSITPSTFRSECINAATPELATDCRRMADSNLSDHNYAALSHPDFVYPAITIAGANRLIDLVRPIANEETMSGLESVYRDYVLTEDTQAAYFMAEFRLADDQFLIAGARWDETTISSTGYLAVNNDNFDIGDGTAVSYDYSIPLDAQKNKYDNILPSIHYRWDPREDLLIRAAVWSSFVRPSFDQSRAYANLESNFELCNPATNACFTTPPAGTTVEDIRDFELSSNNTLRYGNPGLEAMTSVNYDASIGWYADESLFLQAAFFYKDIDKYIVEVQGARANLQDLPVKLPVNQIDGFIIPENLTINNVHWTTNGDKAKVYGVELSASKNFDNGFFVSSNVTLMDSEAYAGETIRIDKTQLPEQADTTGNLTFGWEDDVYSARIIGNYTSEILKKIGACPEGTENRVISTPNDPGATCKKWADIFQDSYYSVDFKATYKFNKNTRLYFDALNITDQYSNKFYRGNDYSGGNVMYHSEVYGRSYQLGVNVTFY
jgi:iron complex outermembrane receptor protein